MHMNPFLHTIKFRVTIQQTPDGLEFYDLRIDSDPVDVREQAATICAIAASLDEDDDLLWHDDRMYEAIGNVFGFVPAAHDLARAAWEQAVLVTGDIGNDQDAEAEAMLRTGWAP